MDLSQGPPVLHAEGMGYPSERPTKRNTFRILQLCWMHPPDRSTLDPLVAPATQERPQHLGTRGFKTFA